MFEIKIQPYIFYAILGTILLLAGLLFNTDYNIRYMVTWVAALILIGSGLARAFENLE